MRNNLDNGTNKEKLCKMMQAKSNKIASLIWNAYSLHAAISPRIRSEICDKVLIKVGSTRIKHMLTDQINEDINAQ